MVLLVIVVVVVMYCYCCKWKYLARAALGVEVTCRGCHGCRHLLKVFMDVEPGTSVSSNDVDRVSGITGGRCGRSNGLVLLHVEVVVVMVMGVPRSTW